MSKYERRVYVIPVGKRTKKWWQFWKKDPKDLAEQEIAKLVSDYNEKINWNKDLFLPSREN